MSFSHFCSSLSSASRPAGITSASFCPLATRLPSAASGLRTPSDGAAKSWSSRAIRPDSVTWCETVPSWIKMKRGRGRASRITQIIAYTVATMISSTRMVSDKARCRALRRSMRDSRSALRSAGTGGAAALLRCGCARAGLSGAARPDCLRFTGDHTHFLNGQHQRQPDVLKAKPPLQVGRVRRF